MPCALVSASYRVLLDAALVRLPQGTFQVTVAGDEVDQGKPHPEPYERACQALGVDARHCVVFEDSETGARSGNAAGALVIAVPNRVDIPPAPRRLQIGSLAELDATRVAALLERADAHSLSTPGAGGVPARGRRGDPAGPARLPGAGPVSDADPLDARGPRRGPSR